jgi:hypothetical protein
VIEEPDTVYKGDYFKIKVIGVDDQDQEVNIDPNCYVAMSIKPDNLLGLYSRNNRYGLIREGVELYVFKEPPSGSQDCNIEIISGIAGASGTGKVTIMKKQAFDHFTVTVVPDTATADTVAYTEGAKLIVQAKDKENKDVELDANSLLKFTMLTNEDYGSFIDANGDTLKTVPVELSNVLYGDAKDGKIKFVAVKKNPDPLTTCQVKVELQSDETKKGEMTIVVVEQSLKIVMTMPYEVRPSIPTEDLDTNMTKLRKKYFEVIITRNKVPVQNHPFRLRTNYVSNTGGHEHGDTREIVRADNNDNYGYFLAEGETDQRRPLDDITNTEGKFKVYYNASIFGDSMKIYLKSRNPKKEKYLQDSVTVVEKVAGLINFRNVASNGRWTFAQSITGETRHPNNNWCAPDFSDSLELAIDDFYQWTLTRKGGSRAITISLNDLSLKFGGRFDISGRWDRRNSQEHLFHRVGTSVDVNPTLSNAKLNKLTEFMGRHNLERNPERTIHYGFNGGN